MIEIRTAGTADFKEIYSLIREFAEFIGTPDKVTITAAQMESDKDYFNCLVATDGEKIIGFATFFTAYYSWSGKATYLDDLYVKESYRGKGTDNRLFNKIIEVARENNCRKLKWQVSRWNHTAIDFYKNKGAAIDEVEINCELNP